MKRFILLPLLLLFLSCSTYNYKVNHNSDDELLRFAEANCFFWYFKKKGYDIEDIGAITGGIVEMGSYSAEKYQQVAFLVKNYKPAVKTKHKIDIDLLKCFYLCEDIEFIQSIEKIK